MQPPTTQGKTRWSRKKKKVMSNEARRKQAWRLRTVHHLTLPHAQRRRAALEPLAAKAIQHQGVLIRERKLKYGLWKHGSMQNQAQGYRSVVLGADQQLD